MKRKSLLVISGFLWIGSCIWLIEVCRYIPFYFVHEWIAAASFGGAMAGQALFLAEKKSRFSGECAAVCNALFLAVLLLDFLAGNSRYPHYFHHYNMDSILGIMILLLLVQTVLTVPRKREGRREYSLKTGQICMKAVCLVGAVALTAGMAGAFAAMPASDEEQGPENLAEYRKQSGLCAAGADHLAFIKKDGSVYAAGNNDYGQCDVRGWDDVVSLSAGAHNTYGLKKDGTVVMAGDNTGGQSAVETWTDIVQIAAGGDCIAGLTEKGTLVFAGNTDSILADEEKLRKCGDMIQVAAGSWYVAGLKSDGSVVVFSDNSGVYKETAGWRNIRMISGGKTHLAALDAEGALYLAGENFFGQCDVDTRRNHFVWAGNEQTVALKENGKLVAVGKKKGELRELSKEPGIISVTDGAEFVAGVRADGRIVIKGDFPGSYRR